METLSDTLVKHLRSSGVVDDARARMRAEIISKLRGNTSASAPRGTVVMELGQDRTDAAILALLLVQQAQLVSTKAVLEADIAAELYRQGDSAVGASSKSLDARVRRMERAIYAALPVHVSTTDDTATGRLLSFFRKSERAHPALSGYRDSGCQTSLGSPVEVLDAQLEAIDQAHSVQHYSQGRGQLAIPVQSVAADVQHAVQQNTDELTIKFNSKILEIAEQYNKRLQQGLSDQVAAQKARVEQVRAAADTHVATVRSQSEQAQLRCDQERSTLLAKMDMLRSREETLRLAERETCPKYSNRSTHSDPLYHSLSCLLRQRSSAESHQQHSLRLQTQRERDVRDLDDQRKRLDELSASMKHREKLNMDSFQLSCEAEYAQRDSALSRSEAELREKQQLHSELQDDLSKARQLNDTYAANQATLEGKYDSCRNTISELTKQLDRSNSQVQLLQGKIPNAKDVISNVRRTSTLVGGLKSLHFEVQEAKRCVHELRHDIARDLDNHNNQNIHVCIQQIVKSTTEYAHRIYDEMNEYKRQSMVNAQLYRQTEEQMRIIKQQNSELQFGIDERNRVNHSLKLSIERLTEMMSEFGVNPSMHETM